MALDGGNDGLDLIKKIIYKSKKILKINGTWLSKLVTSKLIKFQKY